MENPLDDTAEPWQQGFDDFFLIIYIVEMVLKIFALGYNYLIKVHF